MRLSTPLLCAGVAALVLTPARVFASGITYVSDCSASGDLYPPYTGPPTAYCGEIYPYPNGIGFVTGNASFSDAYSNTGLVTNTIAETFQVTPTGAENVLAQMSSQFTDTITLVGEPGGSAYLTILPMNVNSVVSGSGRVAFGYAFPAPCVGLGSTQPSVSNYNPCAVLGNAFNAVVSYNQPITFSLLLGAELEAGVQSEGLNDPLSGAETLVDSGQIELAVTPAPWNGSTQVFFSQLPPFTVDSQLGIDYSIYPITLAPEPGSVSLMFISLSSLVLTTWLRSRSRASVRGKPHF